MLSKSHGSSGRRQAPLANAYILVRANTEDNQALIPPEKKNESARDKMYSVDRLVHLQLPRWPLFCALRPTRFTKQQSLA